MEVIKIAKKDDVSNLLMELQKDILRVSDSKLDKEIRDVYREEVDFMYEEYNPTQYKRRYDNKGFIDETNWDTEVNISKTGNIEYTLTNETETSGRGLYRLDEIIEEGKYTWKNSQIYKDQQKRPVYERTENRLASEQVVENILDSELKKMGW